MRSVLIGAVVASSIALLPTPTMARTVELGPHSESEIKSICNRVGGTSTSDGGTYGCKKACTGGECSVTCVQGLPCVGQTPGRTVTADRHRIMQVLTNSLGEGEQHDRDFEIGLLGLLGLAGLLGLMRVIRRPTAT